MTCSTTGRARVAPGGIPADLPAIARAIEPTSNAALQLFVAHGLEAAHPDAGVDSVFDADGRAVMDQLADACVGDLLAGQPAPNNCGSF